MWSTAEPSNRCSSKPHKDRNFDIGWCCCTHAANGAECRWHQKWFTEFDFCLGFVFANFIFFMKTTPMLSNTIFLADSIIRSFHICFIQRYSFTLFDMILRFQAYEYGIVHCKMLLAVYIQLADCVLSGAQITIKLIISWTYTNNFQTKNPYLTWIHSL